MLALGSKDVHVLLQRSKPHPHLQPLPRIAAEAAEGLALQVGAAAAVKHGPRDAQLGLRVSVQGQEVTTVVRGCSSFFREWNVSEVLQQHSAG